MRVLLATDGSAGSAAAAELVDQIPLDPESAVEVLTVTGANGDFESGELLAATRALLSHTRAGISSLVVCGSAAEEILRVARELDCDLIVVGACGHSALERFFLGSVTERVTRHAPCPVLVARPSHRQLRKVVVGVDSSAHSGYATDWLCRMPLPPHAEIRLVTAIPNLEELTRAHMMLPVPLQESDPTLDGRLRHSAETRLGEMTQKLRAAGRNATTEIRSGDPATTLLCVTDEEDAGLLVVGSHGMGPIERFLLGSVSEKLLRHAHTSVLIVRPPAGVVAVRELAAV